jgi:hypothetical protein
MQNFTEKDKQILAESGILLDSQAIDLSPKTYQEAVARIRELELENMRLMEKILEIEIKLCDPNRWRLARILVFGASIAIPLLLAALPLWLR